MALKFWQALAASSLCLSLTANTKANEAAQLTLTICRDKSNTPEIRTNACKDATAIMEGERDVYLMKSSQMRFSDEELSIIQQCYTKHPAINELDLIATNCQTAATIVKTHLIRGY